MESQDFPPNTRKSREEGEKPEKEETRPVITGKVIRKKKTLLDRTKDVLFGDGRNVRDYVVGDVIVPAVKDLIGDIIRESVDQMLHGSSGSSSRRSERYRRPSGTGSYVSYHRAYNKYRDEPRDRDRDRDRRSYRNSYEVEDIECERHDDALRLRDTIERRVDEDGFVTVGDVYQMAGMDSSSIDEEWGWIDTRGIRIRRVGRGYLLILPRPEAMG